MDKVNLLDLDRQGMVDFFRQLGEADFRGVQALKWIHQVGVQNQDFSFEQMTNFSKALRLQLAEQAMIQAPEIITEQGASDGTRKWLLRLQDGNCIETVFIPEEERGTLCVSSQVGCALNCSFCSTAQQGFNRNLTVAEIIGQVWLAGRRLQQVNTHFTKITNVVMMGMGEPLLNFDNVVKAMDLMMDDFAYGLSKRRVTLSTSGVVPAMRRLAEVSDVALAVSLHAPTNALRDVLVPINKKYPLEELIPVCQDYYKNDPRRRVTFEYVMLQGINDTPEHARQLIKLTAPIKQKMFNLIPFNPFPETKYQRSDLTTINRFRDILMAAGNITITRKTRGDDIDAACGQLVGQVTDRTYRTRKRVKLNVITEQVA